MTLTSHAIAGAAAASIFPQQPVLSFVLGFISHFVLDAIPHTGYKILSDSINPSIGAKIRFDKNFFLDFLRIGGDALLGLILGLFFFTSTQNLTTIIFGIIGALLPDFCQFLYAQIKREPLVSLYKFHRWIHSERKDKKYFFLDPLVPIATTLFIIYISK